MEDIMGNVQTLEIETEVEGKPLRGYLARPAAPGPGVLVLHAWWGLTPFFKQVCVRLAAEGFVVFAPDLFAGKTAQTIEEAARISSEAEKDSRQVQSTVLHALTWLREQVSSQGAYTGLGLIGFSFGGAWAKVASSEEPDDVRAVVLFYDDYEFDLAAVHASFQGHFGELDEYARVESVRKMEADLKSAGLKADFYYYPQAGHWFVESNRPDAYRAADAALAWQRTFTFLKSELV
jgi:carboxymethylenebutenolidase